MPNILDVRTLDAELRAILKEHAVTKATLEIVPSVQEWAQAQGRPEANPFRQATSFPDIGLVVMVETLTEKMARASTSIMNIGPVAHEALALNLRNYARFLLFHEIAHLRGMLEEKPADEWAMARLNEYLAKLGEPPVES